MAEIVFGYDVFRSDGSLWWSGTSGMGRIPPNGPLSCVADLDLDGSPEVVAGNTAYTASGGIYWKAPLSDGYNADANLDGDPFPEIVLVSGGKVY